MNYKEKLIKFNSTEKYKSELDFLLTLLGDTPGASVIDFGCGIGTAIEFLNNNTEMYVYGYDVNCYSEDKKNWFVVQSPVTEKYDQVYFMHSLAHIDNIELTLHKLRSNLNPNGKITAITPNLDWINIVGDTKSDPTVINHFTSKSLSDLFIGAGYKVLKQGQFGEVKNGINERLFIQVCKDSL